jgi:hypothetical protein
LPKAKAQPTLATSGKNEQRFDRLSIGFLHCGDTSPAFQNMLTLESAAEICSRLYGQR